MFRTATTTTTALAVLALGTTGTAVAANVDASAHAEAHAVIDSAKALRMARAGADRAKAYVQSSEDSLGRAYQATASQSRQSSAKGLQATADFSAAAHAQSTKLAALVRTSHGSLRTAAASALSQTGRWEAALVSRVADRLQRQQSSASAQQGNDVATVGDEQASVTTTIVVTASDDRLREGVRKGLERTMAIALVAQADLAKAVAELEQRSQGDGRQGMADAHSSLSDDAHRIGDALRRSGEADVTFSVDGGSVRADDLAARTVDTSDSPATASASGEAHVKVDGGERR